jgi:hypothetical protein
MTDRPPPKPLSEQKRPIIFGAVIFLVLAGALFLYGTRKGDEPTNQFGLRGAPETPAVPSGKR